MFLTGCEEYRILEKIFMGEWNVKYYVVDVFTEERFKGNPGIWVTGLNSAGTAVTHLIGEILP